MKMLKSKKAQVTTFIIIGIAILAGLSLVLYTRTDITGERRIPVIEEIPTQFKPIRTYVDSCIKEKATEAIEKIGHTGGFVDTKMYKVDKNEPTNGDAFRFHPNDPEAIVYWWHFKSDNECRVNCICDSERPNLYSREGMPSIEDEISFYVNEELKNCLDGLDDFEKQGFVISAAGSLDTEVVVGEDDISIIVSYPLNIKEGDSETEITRFLVRIPLNLKRIYSLATEIINNEIRYPILERWTLEQVASFGLGIDENRIPPMTGDEFDSARRAARWEKSDVKNKLENLILPYYTSFLQVFNTANYREREGFYQRAIFIPNAEGNPYHELDVNFQYLNWWPIYLDVKGRGVRGNTIGPETGSFSSFSWLGLQRYNLYYDISYPIMVEITDKSLSLKPYFKDGYTFRFGLESNIRDNKPINCSGTGIAAVTAPTTSLLCDPKQGCANIKIETINAQDNNYVDDVAVFYGVGAEMCSIGRTLLKQDKAVLEAVLPQCVGPACSLMASKEGFWAYPVNYNIRCDTTYACNMDDVLCDKESLTISLEPYRAKNITIRKKAVIKNIAGWNFDSTEMSLLGNEIAIMSLEKIKENPEEDDFMAYVIFNGTQDKVLLEPGLVPGKYNANINLYYNLPDTAGREEIIFKEKEVCVKKNIFGGCSEHTTVGPIKFNESFVEGGSNFEWTITSSNLDQHDNIIFYAISSPDSSSFDELGFDDMEQMNKADELSVTYRNDIEPILR